MRYRSVLPNMSKSNYHLLMKTLNTSQKIETNRDVVSFRKHVLKQLQDHGIAFTLSAFPNISRSTIYNWKKIYFASKFNDACLIPKSTRPKRLRQMKTNKALVDFIISFRLSAQYGFLGKDKLKLFVDAYAKELGIKSISTGTIYKIIKRGNLNKNTHANCCKKVKKQGKFTLLKRVKHAPKVKSPGFIEVDCVTIYLNCKVFYFVCLIDVFTRFAHTVQVPSLKANLATQALQEFITLYQQETGTTTHTVQTDNGSEFLGTFHQFCLDTNLNHIFIYPHHPKINGTIEKFNCTVQKEFLERSEELFVNNLDQFKIKLISYLKWYNGIRPHSALKNQNPITFINNWQSNMYVT